MLASCSYLELVGAPHERDMGVIIVHHCGVEGTRPRGHTSLTGAADAQLAVSRDADENVIVKVEWMKDGAEGEVIASRLGPIEIGTDADGDAISSCVIIPVDSAALATRIVSRRLSDRQRLALDALNEAALASGQSPPIEWQLPAGIQMVGVSHWRDELVRKGVIDRTAANPRAEFKRLRQALAARKRIGDRDDFIWPV